MDPIHELRVEQVMTPAPTSIADSCTLGGALSFLMQQGYESAPVIDREGRIGGVISRAGILACLIRHTAEEGERRSLPAVMALPVAAHADAPLRCAADARLVDAARLLLLERRPSLLVTRGGEDVGILAVGDVVRAVADGGRPTVRFAEARGHCFTPDGRPESLSDESADRALMALLVAQHP